ncbi:MAG TPA: M14 family zinc carboxypeptidase, partial [Chloroflexia bacterium]|nr:M14 family zinc carboxypeptidase [Chloroflexia bacterium]
MADRIRKAATALSLVLILMAIAIAPTGGVGAQRAPVAPAGPAAPAAQTARTNVTVVRVYFRDTAERDRLANELGAEEMDTLDGYLTILADDDLFRHIQTMGVRYEIDQKATTRLNDPNLFGDTFYGGYKTVEEMQAYLAQYAANYPTLATVVDYGDTWCKANPGQCVQPNANNGYDMQALRISNQAIPGPKPVFWFETGIHSREIATPEVSMLYIAYLLDNYNSDPEAHWLVDYHDIWVVPMANPDGHHIVESGGGGSSPYYQRKNANHNNGCNVWPPSISSQFGTDNNRNFPFLWGCCGGSSGSACTQTYRGPTAGSDPETRATVNQLRLLVPDQRGPNNTDPAPITTTGVYQSMHSNAELNLFPWGWTSADAPNDAEMRNIGKHMQAGNAYPSGNGYTTGQPPEVLYAVDGDTADWGYGELGIPSYTTEVGGNDFLVPLSEVVNTMWPLNRGALLYQAKVSRQPYLMAHGPDANSVATNPMTVTQGVSSQLNGTINYAWTSNTYSQTVTGAEYYIDTPPWAGGTAHAMTGNFNGPTVAVNATIDTTALPPGRHVILVRGKGAPYQGLDTWGPITAAWLWVTPVQGTPTPTVTGTPPTATRTRTATQTATRTNTAVATNTPSPVPTVCGQVSASNPAPITINDAGPASPYPSNITVAGAGTVGSIRVSVTGISHTWPDDIDMLLVGPNGGKVLLMSDAGGSNDIASVNLTFQDGSPAIPDSAQITSGTYGPADYEAGDVFPAPAPAGPYSTSLNTAFVGSSANGTWSLYIVDDAGADVGSVSGGWSLTIGVSGGCATVSATPVGPTATRTTVPPSVTTQPSNTVVPPATTQPSATRTNVPGTAQPTATNTVMVPTMTPCPIQFTDVAPTDPFYPFIRCLACRGIISGYSDGTFRGGNNLTRGQAAKIVSNAAGFSDAVPSTQQSFQDVPMSDPFWVFIERLATRGYISGYQCGFPPAGNCVPPANRPYFLTYNNITRGQISKVVANAAGL